MKYLLSAFILMALFSAFVIYRSMNAELPRNIPPLPCTAANDAQKAPP